MDRFLIVNADDFGRSEAVNAGVAEAFRRAFSPAPPSLPPGPRSSRPWRSLQQLEGLGVGIHLVLNEYQPVLPPSADTEPGHQGRTIPLARPAIHENGRGFTDAGRRVSRVGRSDCKGARVWNQIRPHRRAWTLPRSSSGSWRCRRSRRALRHTARSHAGRADHVAARASLSVPVRRQTGAEFRCPVHPPAMGTKTVLSATSSTGFPKVGA